MRVTILLMLILISSCSMMTPQADKGKVAVVEKIAKSLAFKKQKVLSASKSWLKPLKRGQWVATLDVDKKSGETSLIIRKIVRVTKSKITIEIETYSSTNDHPELADVVQQVISGYPKSFKVNGKNNFVQLMSKFKIVSMKIKHGNGAVQDMSGVGQSPLTQMGIKGIVQSVKFGKVTKTKCATKYIRSSRCYKQPLEMGVLGFTFKGENMQHSRVPIVGLISSDSEQFKSEVIAYGFKGRKVIIK